MPIASEAEQFKFLIACIRNSNNGRVDFTEVAKECGIVSKGAAAKRYERLMKANGIAPNATTVRAVTPLPANGLKRDHAKVETGAARDAARLTAKYHAKEEAAKKRLKMAAFASDKAIEDDYEDSGYLALPDVKPEELGSASYLKSEDEAENGSDTATADTDMTLMAGGTHAIKSVLYGDDNGHHSYGLYENLGSFDGAHDIYNAWDKLDLVENVVTSGKNGDCRDGPQCELPSLNEQGEYQGIVFRN